MAREPLAHSAPNPGAAPQTYAEHVTAVTKGARDNAESMLCYYRADTNQRAIMAASIGDAAIFHDSGKLDPDTQAELERGRGARLTWDHVDAGVAHLWACGARAAAWMVRAHHAPGLPSRSHHFSQPADPKLRGCRYDDHPWEKHEAQIRRTDEHLAWMLALHNSVLNEHKPTPSRAYFGLPARLSLSCLVDADHSDTAFADIGWKRPIAPEPRWEERLAALDAYVAELSNQGGTRDALRREFYSACRNQGPDASLVACSGPVGIGKTTAVHRLPAASRNRHARPPPDHRCAFHGHPVADRRSPSQGSGPAGRTRAGRECCGRTSPSRRLRARFVPRSRDTLGRANNSDHICAVL